ncbi:MAG: MarR family transcriptional regulator [Phenylobacterium sp.]|uniref:MarR family winged helix-turn-helix transcriptional regulator n=1 Tax=Phenylobacterium sp. TaxID=1871053 RepID=UPI00273498AD|nr:MarR family transcriptional regulator [Phenylobacterium sp.]MDP3748624.1 MarR family transcriptional regulator [Phenylobacterium sp.]
MTHDRSIPLLDEMRRTPHVCLAEGLRSANRAINKYYAAFVGDLGVGPAQVSILMRLYYLREVTMLGLARHMETDRTTMARNVGVLHRLALLEVVPGRSRREKLIRLTDRGHSLLVQAVPKWREAQDELRLRIGGDLFDRLVQEARVLVEVGGLSFDRQSR